jgi:hypothetical protein
MLLLLESQRPRNGIGRVAQLGLLVFDYITEFASAFEGVGLDQIPKTARIMHIRVLDTHYYFLMGEAVEVVVELSVVPMKVHVELRLKEQLTCVDIVQPQEP